MAVRKNKELKNPLLCVRIGGDGEISLVRAGCKFKIMAEIIEQTFEEWTRGRTAGEARIDIYHRIRDIPYAVVPELIDPERYVQILELNKGSCTPKHFLLGNMYQRLGMLVLYVVYPFRWDEVEIDYPPSLRKLAGVMPTSRHLACRVDIEGKLVLVDATLDPALERLGLPVNKDWDGRSDTLLPVVPSGDGLVYHPSEARRMQVLLDETSLAFYQGLNSWLEEVRLPPGSG